jgi:two-component system, OmpR family, sensor histidine kinase KdpD
VPERWRWSTSPAQAFEYAHTRKASSSQYLTAWRALVAIDMVGRVPGFNVITAGASPMDEASAPARWKRYVWSLTVTLICTAVALPMYPYFELTNIVMAYVLGSTIAAIRFGRGPAIVGAIANVLAFDFCFVPPRFTFSVADVQYIVTLAVMLIVTVVIADLMASVRQQTRVAVARERRTALLYAMSRELAATRGVTSMACVAVRHVAEVFDCKNVVLLPDINGRLHHPREPPIDGSFVKADLSIAQWVVEHGKRAGLGSDTQSAAPALYVPLGHAHERLGVLAVLPSNRRRMLLPEQQHLLEVFAAQLGLAMERARLAEQAEAARVAAERESLQNTLLASISHDLRTPLAVIAGAGSTLAERGHDLDVDSRTSLARSIETKAREMSDLVSNVLDLMRLESGQIVVRRDWQTLDDLIGSALARIEDRFRGHPVDVVIPADLPALYVDASLIVQTLANLLDNVAKYTSDGIPVHIFAQVHMGFVLVTVDDEGPGVPTAELDRLFDKFQRGTDEGTIVGAGLGLAICRAIVEAHGGTIGAGEHPGGGARFQFTLPLKE